MSWPLALVLIVSHLIELSSGVEGQGKCMLDDCLVVEVGPGSHLDAWREASGEHVVGACEKRLDPAQVVHSLSGVRQIIVVPCDKNFCVDEVFRYWFFGIILMK